MNFRQTLQRLRHIGVDPNTDPIEAKYIILVNSVLGIALVFALIYVLMNLARLGTVFSPLFLTYSHWSQWRRRFGSRWENFFHTV